MSKLTQEYLKECLNYDPETGVFTWKKRPLHHFKDGKKWSAKTTCNYFNNRYNNKIAGSIGKDKYHGITINYKRYLSHRLVWLYIEGYFPEHVIDHIDGNRNNNKWNNLRHVSQMCNRQNSKMTSLNTSGVSGVSTLKTGKWLSQITINQKCKTIGYFDNFDDAVRARYNEELNNSNWKCSINSSAYLYLKENNLLGEV